MRYRRGAVAICALVLFALFAWLSCSGEDEGPKPITAPCQELGKLEKFRYTFRYRIHTPKPEGPVDETPSGEAPFAIQPTGDTFSLEQVHEGSFVAPDRFQLEVSTPSEQGAGTVGLLFIANEAFVLSGSSSSEGQFWRPAPESPNTFPPHGVCNALVGTVDFSALTPQAEELNGVKTQHVKLENAELNIAATLFGAASDMGRVAKVYSLDAWIANKGWPARLDAKSTSAFPSGRELTVEISLDIKDANDGDINIVRPKPR